MAPWARASAQVSGEIRGRVSEASSGRPVPGALIELDGIAEVARSGVDGLYRIRGLEPRSYAVHIRALGYVHQGTSVRVANARVTQIDFSLRPTSMQLDRVRVRARRDTSAPNATAFVRGAIEASGSRDLGDLLQTAPGVVVTRAGGPGQSSRVSIRGSSANQVLVLLDGVPLNSAISGTADLSAVSLEQVERVTVLTGAQSARYGPRAMAGVIDIVTRKAEHERSAALRGGALGDWGASAAAATSRPVRSGVRGLSATAEHRTVRGDFSYSLPALRGGGEAFRLNADATTSQVTLTLHQEGESVAVTARGSHHDTERGMAGSIIQPSLTGRQTFQRTNGGLSARWNPSRWALTSTIDATRERANYTDVAPPFGQAFADAVRAHGIMATASATTRVRGMTASGGIDTRSLRVASTSLAIGAPRGQKLAGAWLHGQWERTISAALQVRGDAALRADHSSLLDGVTWSPRVMARITHGRLAVSASYGAGYAPPTLADQFFHEGVQVRPNPDLRPERTRHDVDARLRVRDIDLLGAQLFVEGAMFRSDVDGMILWLPDFRFIWSPSNYDVHRRGWELRSTVRVPALRLDVTGTMDRSAVTYAGGVLVGQVAYRPRVNGSLQSTISIGPARADVGVRHVGVRRVVAGSALNALAPYRMADIRLSSTFSPRGWTLTPLLSVENLFNRQAAMLVDYPFPTRLWSLSLRLRRTSTPPR